VRGCGGGFRRASGAPETLDGVGPVDERADLILGVVDESFEAPAVPLGADHRLGALAGVFRDQPRIAWQAVAQLATAASAAPAGRVGAQAVEADHVASTRNRRVSAAALSAGVSGGMGCLLSFE
jgi:hypothetical protein